MEIRWFDPRRFCGKFKFQSWRKILTFRLRTVVESMCQGFKNQTIFRICIILNCLLFYAFISQKYSSDSLHLSPSLKNNNNFLNGNKDSDIKAQKSVKAPPVSKNVIYVNESYIENQILAAHKSLMKQISLHPKPTPKPKSKKSKKSKSKSKAKRKTEVKPKLTAEIGLKLFDCENYQISTEPFTRLNYKVYPNFIMAKRQYKCDQSITYTTHADFTYLDNLIPLVYRWLGPVSVSVYAPSTDYFESVLRIEYLRKCYTLIKEFVTFHLFFDLDHAPPTNFSLDQVHQNKNKKFDLLNGGGKGMVLNCREKLSFGSSVKTYKNGNNLSYPVNIGRNVARENSQTLYILASDIELYPNPNLIKDFLQLIQKTKKKDQQEANKGKDKIKKIKPKVYMLPIFELEKTVKALPKNKLELQSLIKAKKAIPFHEYVCKDCHRFPRQDKWIKAKPSKNLGTFHIGKRMYQFVNWEPLYIGTKIEPLYDERMSWEGRNDKMSQAYTLCLLDYDFHILNNAFLVHRPGIKRVSKKTMNVYNNSIVENQLKIIHEVILPEITKKYGTKKGCYLL